jgi:alkylation response protein AidB-like acyl-CoA dehydrogenase
VDFAWSQAQKEWKEKTAEFARRELADDVVARDRDQEFNRDAWRKCGEFGLPGLPFPERYGGKGLDLLTTVAALEGLGLGCKDNGFIFSLHAHMWACEAPLLTFGTEAQKERYLPKLFNGQLIGANAISEPEAGSDAFNVQTTAEKRGDRYVLNGQKIYTTNAPIADLMLVFATVDPAKKSAGITGFLVEKGTSGLRVSERKSKMGVRTAQMGSLTLEGCEVHEGQRLGKEGAGLAVFTHAMEWERGFILASAIGTMERQLDECVRFARKRRQFDKPIGKFQQVASKIVEMKLRLETARTMVYKTAWLKDQGKSILMEAALTKLHVSESWVQNSLDAVQIHGGIGYLTEYEIERDVRDALGSRLYSGTSEIQRNIIAQLMRL